METEHWNLKYNYVFRNLFRKDQKKDFVLKIFLLW